MSVKVSGRAGPSRVASITPKFDLSAMPSIMSTSAKGLPYCCLTVGTGSCRSALSSASSLPQHQLPAHLISTHRCQHRHRHRNTFGATASAIDDHPAPAASSPKPC